MHALLLAILIHANSRANINPPPLRVAAPTPHTYRHPPMYPLPSTRRGPSSIRTGGNAWIIG